MSYLLIAKNNHFFGKVSDDHYERFQISVLTQETRHGKTKLFLGYSILKSLIK